MHTYNKICPGDISDSPGNHEDLATPLCPSHVKNSSYTTYVRPTLDYACSVWSPYHQHNISKIEMVQRRAARFVTNNYDWNASVTDMLQHLQWEPLQDRRNNFRAITMYKIVNNLIDSSPPEGCRQLSNSVTRGHPLRFTQLQTNVDSYKYSFYPYAIHYGIVCQILL